MPSYVLFRSRSIWVSVKAMLTKLFFSYMNMGEKQALHYKEQEKTRFVVKVSVFVLYFYSFYENVNDRLISPVYIVPTSSSSRPRQTGQKVGCKCMRLSRGSGQLYTYK